MYPVGCKKKVSHATQHGSPCLSLSLSHSHSLSFSRWIAHPKSGSLRKILPSFLFRSASVFPFQIQPRTHTVDRTQSTHTGSKPTPTPTSGTPIWPFFTRTHTLSSPSLAPLHRLPILTTLTHSLTLHSLHTHLPLPSIHHIGRIDHPSSTNCTRTKITHISQLGHQMPCLRRRNGPRPHTNSNPSSNGLGQKSELIRKKRGGKKTFFPSPFLITLAIVFLVNKHIPHFELIDLFSGLAADFAFYFSFSSSFSSINVLPICI